MKPQRIYYQLLIGVIFLLSISCSKEDPIPLIADAGQNQTISPNELVTLDGSESKGPEGFIYLWTYSGDVPESEIDFQGNTTANPSFIPPKGSVYSFTLTITSGDQTSDDQLTVVASGGIEIGGELAEDLALVDIEPDADVPDYIVTSDLIVPAGITLSVKDENVVVFFETETGLHVTDGGKLTNMLPGQEEGLNIKFTGEDSDGWKGILIENSIIDLNNATIENAGKTKFTETSEPASLILTGGQTNLISIDGNKFINSFSYDVMVTEKIGGTGYFKHNDLSYKNPVKAHVTFLNHYISNYPNIYPENIEYNIIVPSGADTKDTISGTFQFYNSKFLIDGDFWAGSRLSINSATVYIKEGCGILAEDDFNCTGLESSPTLVSGHEGAQWKGIAAIDRNHHFAVKHSTIENAGYGIISMGDFTAEANATLYAERSTGSIENSKILNGGGFGYYADTSSHLKVSIRVFNSEFRNLQKAAIRTSVLSVSELFTNLKPNNIFDLPIDVPAVLVQGDGSPTLNWPGLGSGNYYLIDANIITSFYDGFVLKEGAHLKFKAGRAYVYNPPFGSNASPVSWKGSADKPIILEGENDTPGSWGGVYLGGAGGWFEVEHCEIKNGGEFILPGATEKANVVSAYSTKAEYTSNLRFNNTVVSGSKGYGIVVEAGTLDFEFDNPGKNNTFSNNASGNVLVK